MLKCIRLGSGDLLKLVLLDLLLRRTVHDAGLLRKCSEDQMRCKKVKNNL